MVILYCMLTVVLVLAAIVVVFVAWRSEAEDGS